MTHLAGTHCLHLVSVCLTAGRHGHNAASPHPLLLLLSAYRIRYTGQAMARLLSDKAMAEAGIEVDPRRHATDLLYDAASSAPIVVAIFVSLLGAGELLTRIGIMHHFFAVLSGYVGFFAYSLLASYCTVLVCVAVTGWVRIKRQEGRNPLHDAAMLLSKLSASIAGLYCLGRTFTKISQAVFLHSSGYPTTMAGYVEFYAVLFLLSYAAVLVGTGVVGYIHMKASRF